MAAFHAILNLICCAACLTVYHTSPQPLGLLLFIGGANLGVAVMYAAASYAWRR